MIKALDGVLLSSADTKKLADFYQNVVGLSQTNEWEMGEERQSGFEFADVKLFINPHDKVKGENKHPERYMLNFEVDDIEKEVEKIKEKGAKQVQDIYHVEGYGLISTFEDVDGNYFQLVQVKESSN